MVEQAAVEPTTTPEAHVDEIVHLVRSLAAALEANFHTRAAELDLTPQLAGALIHLDPERQVPMRELAGRLRCDPSNITGIIDRLEERGLVERRTDPRDRRVRALARTPAGDAVAARLWERLQANSPIQPLPFAESRQLLGLLRQLAGEPSR